MVMKALAILGFLFLLIVLLYVWLFVIVLRDVMGDEDQL